MRDTRENVTFNASTKKRQQAERTLNCLHLLLLLFCVYVYVGRFMISVLATISHIKCDKDNKKKPLSTYRTDIKYFPTVSEIINFLNFFMSINSRLKFTFISILLKIMTNNFTFVQQIC